MNAEKMARLKKKGYRFTTAAEFLGLSEREQELVRMRLVLSRLIREKRKKQRLSQTDFAKLLGSSQSRVAKIEAGDPTVTIDLMLSSAFGLGTTVRDLGRIMIKAPSPAHKKRERVPV